MTRGGKLWLVVGAAFFFLINYPLLQIFNRNLLVAGIPLLILYLFAIWVLAIVLLAGARRFFEP